MASAWMLWSKRIPFVNCLLKSIDGMFLSLKNLYILVVCSPGTVVSKLARHDHSPYQDERIYQKVKYEYQIILIRQLFL